VLSVRQSYRVTVAAKQGAAFSDQVVLGTVGGSALPTDASPNVTPPSAGRIVRARATSSLCLAGQSVLSGVIVPIALASLTFQVWFFDTTQAVWVPIAVPTTFTPTAVGINNLIFTTIGGWFGVQIFLQVTANTAVQCLTYGSY
jgi:hypothetical protein